MFTDKTELKKPRVRLMSSSRLFRPDYRRHVRITYAEAADYAGVGVGTIYNWVSTGRIRLAAKIGPYRISFEKFMKFIECGVWPEK